MTIIIGYNRKNDKFIFVAKIKNEKEEEKNAKIPQIIVFVLN